jgi:hypothetical protein
MPTWGDRINRTLGLLTASNRTLSRVSAVGTGVAPPEITVPADERWRVIGVVIRIVTSAVVGNRNLRFEIEVGGALGGAIQSAVNIAASKTVVATFSPGNAVSPGLVGDAFLEPFAECISMPGDILRGLASANGKAGDVITLVAHAEREAVAT